MLTQSSTAFQLFPWDLLWVKPLSALRRLSGGAWAAAPERRRLDGVVPRRLSEGPVGSAILNDENEKWRLWSFPHAASAVSTGAAAVNVGADTATTRRDLNAVSQATRDGFERFSQIYFCLRIPSCSWYSLLNLTPIPFLTANSLPHFCFIRGQIDTTKSEPSSTTAAPSLTVFGFMILCWLAHAQGFAVAATRRAFGKTIISLARGLHMHFYVSICRRHSAWESKAR